MSAKNDLRDVERELARLGFALVREGNHRIWQRAGANGTVTVVVPKAHRTGDPRAVKNLWAQVRRLQKEEQQP